MYNNIKPKILIVDDLKDNRLVMKLTLKKGGDYEFIEAQNGQEGYDKAVLEHPHLILMDAMMPVMNGFEAIRLLRNNTETKDIPIIMVSALDNKDEKVKALQSGISDFISKPFDKTELRIRVNSLLHLYIQFLKKHNELKDINNDLEAKVNEKLEERVEDIKLASIGRITAGITHELNTPVTYMKSNLELLKYDIEDIQNNQELKKNIFETLNILDDGLQRLKGIIDNTREISKKSSNEKHNENLYATLITASRMVYNRFKHLTPVYINGTQFSLDINENFELFEKDIIKQKIEQVWIIILNNACDEFAKSKKEFEQRRIDIDLSYKDKDLVIKFKDNAGKGIPDEILPNIFEPFKSTKIDSGMGVGLNIAKEIIESHNGTIKAYNEDNCAVFEITI
ncbi:MAG: hybrid sensor histidine kinase/response regulator [Campylobacterota bacterium]|nr:hybrid sensor histidine kinase/response regulator [Campylobacterota bacterium]